MSADFPTWERVDKYETTFRLKLPGGWVYKSIVFDEHGAAETETMCFVPRQPGYQEDEAETNWKLEAAEGLAKALRHIVRVTQFPVSDVIEEALKDADAAIAKWEGRS